MLGSKGEQIAAPQKRKISGLNEVALKTFNNIHLFSKT